MKLTNTLLQLLILPCLLYASADTSSGRHFFRTVEDSIRYDYRICTGDTTVQEVKTLIQWRALVDSIITLPDYSAFVKQYIDITRKHVNDILPCEIAAWKIEQDRKIKEIDDLLTIDKLKRNRAYNDSLYVINDLARTKHRSCDFFDIPFGVTKKTFRWLFTRKSSIPLLDQGTYFKAPGVIVLNKPFSAAYHFDGNGLFCAFELEGETHSADSLNNQVWPDADTLSALYAGKINKAPDHVYRIGYFDIVQGRLAINKTWNLDDQTVYIGIATYKYQYYAKAVVQPK